MYRQGRALRPLSAVLAAFLIVLSATTAGAQKPAASPDRRESGLPRFERSVCHVDGEWARASRRDCGWLIVPERRGAANSGRIRLALEIFRGGDNATAPPIVFLHGGPGGAGGIRTFSAAVASAPFARDRDVVIFDQRGAGLSQPKLCPDYDSVTAKTYNMRTSPVRDSLLKAARRACVALLDKQGIHRDAYSTAENAADAIDLRRVLGYHAWIVYGGSYGARLAQELMRRDSAAVIAAILASPAPQAFSRQAEQPLLTQRAFERLFAECRLQPTCRDAFPDVEGDFYRGGSGPRAPGCSRAGRRGRAPRPAWPGAGCRGRPPFRRGGGSAPCRPRAPPPPGRRG